MKDYREDPMEPAYEHVSESEPVSGIEQAVLRKLKLRDCTIQELRRALPDYSWNQVLIALNRLSRAKALTVRYSPRVHLYLLSAAQAKTGSCSETLN